MTGSSVIDAQALPLQHRSLPETKAVTSGVTTASVELGSINGLSAGVWEHAAGVSTDVEQDEMFVVISGRGRIILDNGEVLLLQPGTVGRLRAEESTRWEIDEPLRKVWFTPA